MPRARIFFVYGRAAEDDVGAGDGPAADGSRVVCANGCGQSDTGGAAYEGCAGKREERCFLFLGEKIRRCFLCLLGSDSSGSATIAALGYRHRRENGVGAVAAQGGKTQLVEG